MAALLILVGWLYAVGCTPLCVASHRPLRLSSGLVFLLGREQIEGSVANLDELALSLKTLIENEDFWLKLRFNGELDRDTFNKVLSLLNEYAQQATSETRIHKSVARWAFDLHHELTASNDHATINDWPQRDDLDNAISELVYVLDLLF